MRSHRVSKVDEYRDAMGAYHRRPIYRWIGLAVSASVIFLQAVACLNVEWSSISPLAGIFSIAVAYVLTDFVNGLVHMYMDNTDDYKSPIGPLIAAFHLHHKHSRYRDSAWPLVYVVESGAKNWLVVYLALTVWAQIALALPPALSLGLAAFGVLSSCAEVSHYLCHNSASRAVGLLQRMRVLLPPGHHAIHHTQDNVNYAFLNGMSDPLLNAIARRFCKGYVGRSDLHARAYAGPQSANRQS